MPHYINIAKKYSDNQDILIGKMDLTANDLPTDLVSVTAYPSV
jgi:hypothetical protein